MKRRAKPDLQVWAVVPVKDFDLAKSRLAGVLSPAARRALAERLFERVLAATRACPGVARTLIATDSASIAAHAGALGLGAVLDGQRRGLGPVVDQALEHAGRGGADAALVLMGDLPQLQTADVEALLGALREHDVVLAPDRQGAGTNAMGLWLPAGAATCFGHADSYARHQAWSEALGASRVTLQRVGLGFDVDTPGDLESLGDQNMYETAAT